MSDSVKVFRLIASVPDPLTRHILEALLVMNEELNDRAAALENAPDAMDARIAEDFAKLRADLEAQAVTPETLARFDALVERISSVDPDPTHPPAPGPEPEDTTPAGDGGDDTGDE